MRSQVVRALFLDALYQVLDNKVFRILSGVVLALVLATFLVGAREDSLVLLFGWKEIFYQDIFSFFQRPYPGVQGAGQILVQGIQKILIDNLAGTVGIMFAIAATAFFVPRMLEKGAADTLFSKPVSRFALLMSRYLAGLLFVAILAVVLVGGMALGFRLNSGYSDPGFLWSILTLIYVFALLHGVSILVGVVTRSTVAAILVTLFFMIFTGCVHKGWQLKEQFHDNAVRQLALEASQPAEPGTGSPPATEEEHSRWLDLAYLSLDAIHYVLPKTTDAAAIASKMRRDLTTRYAELWDPEGGLLVLGPPEGWERRTPKEALGGEGVVWALPDGSATVRLTRRPLDSTTRMRSAKALLISLENRPGMSGVKDGHGRIANTETSQVYWNEGERLHIASFFQGGRYLYELESEGTNAWREDPGAREVMRHFVNGFTFNESQNATDPFQRFQHKIDWDAPLKYNIFFSIGSSLAFLALVLALAGWKLARIDF